jgi:hypothetical protein
MRCDVCRQETARNYAYKYARLGGCVEGEHGSTNVMVRSGTLGRWDEGILCLDCLYQSLTSLILETKLDERKNMPLADEPKKPKREDDEPKKPKREDDEPKKPKREDDEPELDVQAYLDLAAQRTKGRIKEKK